jgi:predicted enzyme related to lactoylglutathione lyase
VIGFQQVEDVKRIKNRLHLDVKVPDLDVAIERVTALGDRAAQECIKKEWRWYVMADPEDNEFCIVTN